MKRSQHLITLVLAVAAATIVVGVTLAAPIAAAAPESKRPRSVVYLIGDGFGPVQVTLGRLYAGKALALDGMAVHGSARTYSLTGAVTDSAAAATSLASGVKTHNGVIGQDGDKGEAPTVFDAAERAGMATGVVTSTRVTHATPACFYAHARNRGMENQIAEQLVGSDLEVALGGGARFFPAERLAKAKANGWRLVQDRKALRVEAKRGDKLLGLFNDSHVRYGLDRRGEDETEPTLLEMTDAALDVLGKDGRAFALMVEGGRIDHAGHAHDAAAMAREAVDFDAVVARVLQRAEAAGDWLVVITADHATGNAGISERIDLEALRGARASAEEVWNNVRRGHGDDYEPKAAALTKLAAERWSVELDADEVRAVIEAKGRYENATTLAHIVSEKMGVAFFTLDEQRGQLTHGHDGVDVPVWAAGPGAARFNGNMNNTEIPGRIEAALGLGAGARSSETPPRRTAPGKRPVY